MRIAYINSESNSSTGSIIQNLTSQAVKQGNEVCFITAINNPFPFIKDSFVTFRGPISHYATKINADISGRDGFANHLETKKAIRFLKAWKPDVIHLNNPTDHYLDLRLLLNYIAEEHIPTVYSVHDCWLLSGRCVSFGPCEKWKTGCGHCPYRKNGQGILLCDRSAHYWKLKRALINNTPYLELACASRWMKDTLSLGGFNKSISIVHNGVDLSTFKPSPKKDDLITLAQGRKIILFASAVWNEDKGLNYLREIASKIDQQRYFLVAAGLQGQAEVPGVYTLPLIRNRTELASFFSTGDIFVNLTLFDTYSMVNLEAMACGTPVISFASGGATEMLQEGINGYSVKTGDVISLLSLLDKANFERSKVAQSVQDYDAEHFFDKYLVLYQKVIAEKNH
jgi:putative colanic acid biosynthesis glycosyltransferase